MLNLLQFLILIVSFVFLIFAFDAYKRKGINILHFIVFILWSISIFFFSVNDELLNKFWAYFGLARWADLIVYISIIFLAYLYFEIMNKITKQEELQTDLIKLQAIQCFIDKNNISNIKNNTKNDDYIFLIRVFNEWKVLSNTIDEVINNWYRKILIINDWSIDNSYNIIKEKKEKYKNVYIFDIHHIINRGGWSANKTWFYFISKYSNLLNIKYIVTFDADWQMNIKDLNSFKKFIGKYDILLWSRFIKWWSANNIPNTRKIILFWSKIITLFFNWVWISDPHNWYRVINIQALKKIKITSDWMTYASEILDSIRINKFEYKEIPVNINYTDYSIKKWQKNLNAFKILIELIYKKLFFR